MPETPVLRSTRGQSYSGLLLNQGKNARSLRERSGVKGIKKEIGIRGDL